MELDTQNTIYIGTDATNGTVHVLKPHNRDLKYPFEIVHLKLDDRDAESTDAAEYKLLEQEMDETRIDL